MSSSFITFSMFYSPAADMMITIDSEANGTRFEGNGVISGSQYRSIRILFAIREQKTTLLLKNWH